MQGSLSTFPGAGLISVAASCSGGFPMRPLASGGAGDTLRCCFLHHALTLLASVKPEGPHAMGAWSHQNNLAQAQQVFCHSL